MVQHRRVRGLAASLVRDRAAISEVCMSRVRVLILGSGPRSRAYSGPSSISRQRPHVYVVWKSGLGDPRRRSSARGFLNTTCGSSKRASGLISPTSNPHGSRPATAPHQRLSAARFESETWRRSSPPPSEILCLPPGAYVARLQSLIPTIPCLPPGIDVARLRSLLQTSYPIE